MVQQKLLKKTKEQKNSIEIITLLLLYLIFQIHLIKTFFYNLLIVQEYQFVSPYKGSLNCLQFHLHNVDISKHAMFFLLHQDEGLVNYRRNKDVFRILHTLH